MRQRNNMEVWTPAEMAIYNAMREVEKMPAHIKLTDAVILLSKAQNAVADYLEEVEQPVPSKESQKQSLIELMESDQRDGIYGVRDLEELRWAFYEAMSQGYQYKDVHPMRYFPQWWSKMKKDIYENLNKEQEDKRSVASKAKSTDEPMAQNTTKEPVISQDDIEQIIEQHCNQSSREAHYNAAEQIYKLFKPYLKSNSEPAIEKDTQIEKALIEIRGKLVYNEFTRLLKEHLGWHPTELRMSSAKYFVEKGSITGGFFEAIRNIAHQYSAFVLEQPLLNKYKNEQLKSNSEPVIDWEGLEKDYSTAFREKFFKEPQYNAAATKEWNLNWLKSNLPNYIK